jgi:diguanylate cyclase (GGDEF)-like protein
MNRLVRLVSTLTPREVFVTAIAFVFAIGWFDHLTGPYVSFALVYLPPIAFATWLAGRPFGITIACISTIIGLTTELSSELSSKGFIPYWNAAARFGVFALVVAVLASLRESHESQRHLARTDPLTGAANARFFAEEAERQIAGARRYGHPLTLAYVDLDSFKAINDTFGHSTGDVLLRVVADTLAANARPTDLVARLGGDEFVVLLPQTDAPAAVKALGRIRAELVAGMSAHGWAVTFSIGVAALHDRVHTIDEFVAAADALMYDAKRAGKDLIAWVDNSVRRFEPADGPVPAATSPADRSANGESVDGWVPIGEQGLGA